MVSLAWDIYARLDQIFCCNCFFTKYIWLYSIHVLIRKKLPICFTQKEKLFCALSTMKTLYMSFKPSILEQLDAYAWDH